MRRIYSISRIRGELQGMKLLWQENFGQLI